MAATILPKPGSRFVCEDDMCGHIDCAAYRKDAETPCHVCGKPLGTKEPVYARKDKENCGHERCEHEQVSRLNRAFGGLLRHSGD